MEDVGQPVTDRKPIHIYIMSPGGHLEYMWMLIDAIRASVTPVYTINTGVAASAAALIFISGHKRFMMKNATTLFHEGSASMQGDAVKIMDASDNYRKALDRMKKYIIDNTRITPKQLGKKLHNDWELDAEQCLEAGVCDVLVSILDEVI